MLTPHSSSLSHLSTASILIDPSCWKLWWGYWPHKDQRLEGFWIVRLKETPCKYGWWKKKSGTTWDAPKGLDTGIKPTFWGHPKWWRIFSINSRSTHWKIWKQKRFLPQKEAFKGLRSKYFVCLPWEPFPRPFKPVPTTFPTMICFTKSSPMDFLSGDVVLIFYLFEVHF